MAPIQVNNPGTSAGLPDNGNRPPLMLKTGQILTGRVIDTGGERMLRLGGHTLPLTTDSHPPAGTRLLLEVLTTRPSLSLRVLEQVSPETRGSSDSAPVRSTLFRNALASQLDTRDLLGMIRQLNSASGRDTTLNTLRAALEPVLRAIPDSGQASRPDGLANAIRQSGLFTEQRLLNLLATRTSSHGRGPDPLGGDWKAALGRALAHIHSAVQADRLPAPASGQGSRIPGTIPPPPGVAWNVAAPTTASAAGPETASSSSPLLRDLPETVRLLIQRLDGATARTELHQLVSNPGGDDPAQRLQLWFEIPIQHQGHYDLWQFHLREEERRRGEKEAAWRVTLAVHLPSLGPVFADIALRGERISLRLTAEQTESVSRIREHIGEMRQRLRDAGLRLQRLSVGAGPIPVDDSSVPPRLFRSQA